MGLAAVLELVTPGPQTIDRDEDVFNTNNIPGDILYYITQLEARISIC